MGLLNEHEATGLKWFNVKNTPVGFDKLALYDNDVYLPIEAFNLTRANVVAYMVETNSGNALVTLRGDIFLSGQTAIDMCSQAHPQQVDELELCISSLFDKALESELILYPVNEKPF